MNTEKTIEINLEDYELKQVVDLADRIKFYLKDRKEEVQELAEARKEAAKARKEAEKAEKVKAGKALVERAGVEGEITVEYKGTQITGTVTKIKDNGKTFNVNIEWDGETVNIWRYYSQVVLPQD